MLIPRGAAPASQLPQVPSPLWPVLAELAARGGNQWQTLADTLDVALEEAKAGIWWHDVARGQSVWSGQLHGMLGVPNDQAVNPEAFVDGFVIKEDQALTKEALEAAFETGHSSFTYRIRRTDGQTRWLSTSISRRADDDQNLFCGITEDITEQRQALASLDTERKQLIEFIAHGDSTLVLLDEALNYAWALNLDRYTGIPDEQMKGRPYGSLAPAAQRSEYQQAAQLARDTGAPQMVKGSALIPNGDERFFVTLLRRYTFSDGRYGVLIRSQDATETEQARQVADLELRRLADALKDEPITLVLLDEQLRYLWVRNPHPKWAKVQNTELPQCHLDLMEPKSAHLLDMLARKVITTGKPLGYKGFVTPLGGEPIYFRVRMMPHTLHNGELGVLLKAYDLSEEHRLRQAVEQELERLVEALKDEPITISLYDESLTMVWLQRQPTGWENIEAARLATMHLSEALAPVSVQVLEPLFTEVLAESRTNLYTGPVYPPGATEPVPMRIRMSPYSFLDGKKGVLVFATDLTEIQKTERALEETNLLLNLQLTALAATEARLQVEQTELREALASLSASHKAKLDELEAARLTHRALLPTGEPMPDRLDYAVHLETSLEVGGDYYDYRRQGERLLLAVGDATGHGLHSATVVAMVKAYIQLLAQVVPQATIMARVSDALRELALKQMYMGLLLLELLPDGFNYCSAGMPPIFIYRHVTGLVERELQPGLFLGAPIVQHYPTHHIPMASGDLLVALSDGLIETMDANRLPFSYKEIEDCIAKAAPGGSKEVIRCLINLQKTRLQGQLLWDDTTVMALGWR